MKILLTTDMYRPMISGIAVSTEMLYRELKKLGHDVKVLTLSRSEKGEENIDGDIYYLKSYKIKPIPNAKISNMIFGDIEKEIMEWKPDIIHSQTEFSTFVSAGNIAKRTGSIRIHTCHSIYEDYFANLFKGKIINADLASKLMSKLFGKLDALIAPTQKVKESLINQKIDKPVFIVPTGVNTKKFRKRISGAERAELMQKYGLEGKKILIYVGRVSEEKNIDEIIEYYALNYLNNDDLRLLIVGGGKYLDDIKELAVKFCVEDKVIFTGPVTPENIAGFYQLGHIFVTSSTRESQGLTYIEALASGVPVICRKDPCIDGIVIEGKNGYVYENIQEFKKKTGLLIDDESLRLEFAAEAEKKAEEYSSGTFGLKISGVYEEIFSGKSAL